MSRTAQSKVVADPGTIRWLPAFMLCGFWDEMTRRGVSLAELERASGLTRPLRGDFFSAVRREAVHALYEAAIALTGDVNLGLSVGRANGAASYHLVGLVGLASSTLAEALELGAQAQTHIGLELPEIAALPDGRLRFGRAWGDHGSTPGERFEAEMAGATLYDFALNFLDRSLGAPTVQFAFHAPADLAPYRRVFSGRVEFEAEGTYIVFPRRALLRRRSGADSKLVQQLLRLAEEQYGGSARRPDNWTSRVSRALRAHTAPRLLESTDLAAQLGLSSRALARRLAREGASVSSLLDAELYRRAQGLLQLPGATASQVASALGYAELSSFFRAFRRWSGGLTPGVYRQQTAHAQ